MIVYVRRLAASDANRNLVVPVISAVSVSVQYDSYGFMYTSPFQEPDKDALMENIQAITPNHEARMQSLAVS